MSAIPDDKLKQFEHAMTEAYALARAGDADSGLEKLNDQFQEAIDARAAGIPWAQAFGDMVFQACQAFTAEYEAELAAVRAASPGHIVQ